MSKQEQSINPPLSWLRPIVVPSPLDRREPAKYTRSLIATDRHRAGTTRDFIKDQYSIFTGFIPLSTFEVLRPETREHALWGATADFIRGRNEQPEAPFGETPLRVLFVTHGGSVPERDRTLPFFIGLTSQSGEVAFDMMGFPPFYSEQTRNSSEVFFDHKRRFSQITEQELEAKADEYYPQGGIYDLIVVLGDNPRRDEMSGTDASQGNTRELAELLVDSLARNGRIITSAHESLDALRADILMTTLLTEEATYVAQAYDETVFIDPRQPKVAFVPETPQSDDSPINRRIVWSIGRGPVSYQEETAPQRRRLLPQSRKARFALAGAGVVAAAVAVPLILEATQSSGGLPQCAASEIAVYPQSITPVGPNDTDTKFTLLDNQAVTITTDNGVSTISLYKNQPFQQKEAVFLTGDGEKNTLFIGSNGNDEICAVPPAPKTPTSPVPSTGAAIPGVSN